jgi:hypothetical protein
MPLLEPVCPKSLKVLREASDKLERTLVTHVRFKEALGMIRNRLLFPSDSNLLFIVGLTGVGKSRLYRTAQKMVMEMMEQNLLQDPSRLPYVAFEVQSTNVGNFAWGPFYNDYQTQLQLPLSPDKKVLGELSGSAKDLGRHQVLLSSIAHRRPQVVFLDEANHLCQVSNPRLLSQQLDKVKSLANKSKVLHVFFGTYELAALFDASAQLARRSDTFHFSRYRWDQQGDLKSFTDMVKIFGNSLPLDHTLDLGSRSHYIYERTLGCAGTLKTWLMNALGAACREGRTYVKLADLEATAMPVNKLRRILTEAQNKESIIDERDTQTDLLHALLKQPYAEQKEIFFSDDHDATKNRRSSTCTRKPSSDPTGAAFTTNPDVQSAI